MTTRRSFLGAILAAGVAPAIVKASSLMPVRPVGALILPGDADFNVGSRVFISPNGSNTAPYDTWEKAAAPGMLSKLLTALEAGGTAYVANSWIQDQELDTRGRKIIMCKGHNTFMSCVFRTDPHGPLSLPMGNHRDPGGGQ